MRQRKTKNLEEKLLEFGDMMVDLKAMEKGKWLPKLFGACEEEQNSGREEPRKRLFIEIGSGKGRFISTLAKSRPEDYFVGIEGQQSVAHKAMKLAKSMEIANLRFAMDFVDKPEELWEDGELAGIYLNFSDPWPKKRHAKRRLTYHKKLIPYSRIVGPGGFIQFKTDNDPLFESALEEIEIAGLEILELTRDLHNSEFMEGNIMTEYEEKFSNRGEKINMVKIAGKVWDERDYETLMNKSDKEIYGEEISSSQG